MERLSFQSTDWLRRMHALASKRRISNVVLASEVRDVSRADKDQILDGLKASPVDYISSKNRCEEGEILASGSFSIEGKHYAWTSIVPSYKTQIIKLLTRGLVFSNANIFVELKANA